MSTLSDSSAVLWPLGVYIVAVVVMVALMLILSALLGERHRERATDDPYECGVVSTGSARLRFHAGFYLMAMFFVIFDLEAAFIYAYAVAFRELGWMGYAEIAGFRRHSCRSTLLPLAFGSTRLENAQTTQRGGKLNG